MLCAGIAAHEGHEAAPPAPGWTALPYAPPVPGTYALPPIRAAADAEFIDDTGAPRRLHEIYRDGITVLSFIYTQCADANGCPLASFVVGQAAAEIAKDAALAGRVRFVSLSFDLARDTPAALADYARHFRKPGVAWIFGVPRDAATLSALLAAYGQDLERSADGGTFSHVLRVYLVDGDGRIRNEYTTSFLHASMLTADIRTLALAAQTSSAAPRAAAPTDTAPPGPGDDKRGYERADYATRSRALTARDAAPAALRARLLDPPRGLPRGAQNGPVPGDAQIALGRKLFFDRRLSHNDTLACAGCHVPDQGFTNNELMTPIGIEGRTVKRNAPTLLNVGFLPRLFQDARESRLEQQVWGPLLAFNEMGNPSIGYVLDELAALPEYAPLFAAAFPDEPQVTMNTLAAALAAYERALVAGDSDFDRWRYGGEATALSAVARRGFELFTGKAGCSACHLLGEESALFTDHGLHNTGIGYRHSMRKSGGGTLDVLVAPGQRLAVAGADIAASSETPPNDLGRYEVTLDPADRWRYRTPSLRNVALTAPYMHDGSLPTLAAVIDFYAAGGVPNEGLDPRVRPLALSAAERDALRAFLESLTSHDVATLVRDAYAVPIGDRGATAR
ncbi:MAG TPA: cytochrome c peroxidase [Gammaproteobacteria bacterium]|nr:cytochrome c peroxidase [Gammaproteobacteria bacterium]